MKKTGMIITAILAALALVGCADIVRPSFEAGDNLAPGMGRVLVSIGPQGARTIMPTDYSDLSYTYEFTTEGKEAVSGTMTGPTESVDLEPGTWELTVRGLKDGTAALEGRAAGIEISAGQQTSVPVSMTGIVGSDRGNLTYTVTFPDTVSSGFFRVYQWNKEVVEIQVNLLDGTPNGDGTKTKTGVLNLPSGYYRAALDLIIVGTPGKMFNQTEIAHIYPGLTTQAAFTVGMGDFMSTTRVDDSQTNLAAALGTISGLTSGADVVYILTPGSEIMTGRTVSNANGPVKVTIDGGGRVVSLNGSGALIVVGNNVTLAFRNITLMGRGVGVDNNNALMRVASGGRLELGTGAKITGNKNTSSFSGGGVDVDSSGTFTMSGGEITGNTASDYSGGGVYVDEGTFTMIGGKITGNTASSFSSFSGGGVCIWEGTFTMIGGEITGNTASASYSSGGGVYVYNNGTFTMSGGEITGNTASASSYSGGGVCVYSNGTFTKTGGGTISDTNTATNGKVAYVVSPSKKRNTTAGPGVDMDSNKIGTAGGWE
jgi:hypothetical protein